MILFSQTAINPKAADWTEWKEALRYCLSNNFPSLFDQATINKNKEAFARYEQWWSYERELNLTEYFDNPITASDVSSDIIIDNRNIPNLYIPFRCEFYDLDNDKMPEAIIVYAPLITHGGAWGEVYKLYGTSYERIGSLSRGEYGESFYINPENRIVSAGRDSTRILEIKNKEIVYSEYIDSMGSNTYNGMKYSEIGNYSSDFFMFENKEEWLNTEVFLADLRLLPQIDCSDVVEAAKNSVYAPKTGDNYVIIWFAMLIASCFAAVKIKKYKIKENI